MIAMGHYVYKYVLDNEIIYIGKADSSLIKRLSEHGRDGDNIDKSGWDEINRADIYYVVMPNETYNDIFESVMINKYHPKYNKAKMSEWSAFPLPEPEWIKFGSLTINDSPSSSNGNTLDLSPSNTIYDRIAYLCCKYGMTIFELEKQLGFSCGAISNWRSKSMPSTSKLVMIASFFNVSMDFLMVMTEEEKMIDDLMDDELRMTYELWKVIPPNKRRRISLCLQELFSNTTTEYD